MALLFDLAAVPDLHCDACLDDLAKAMSSDPDGRDTLLWQRVANEWIADHVEDVSGRLEDLLAKLRAAFARLLGGEPLGQLAKAEVPWLRWDQSQFDAVRRRLEAKPPEQFTLEEWMLVVDYLVQRYLPDDVLHSESEYLTVRAKLLGMLQANMAASAKPPRAPIVKLLPARYRAIPPKVLTPVEVKTLHIAMERTATALRSCTDLTRARMKQVILEHVQAKVLGQPEGTAGKLEQALFDSFAATNRDFRRIAVTEAGEACNTGFIGAQMPGAKVERREAYAGACEFCRSINGRVFKVVDPAARVKDGNTEVWVGKSNVGRSAAVHRRVGKQLVERTDNERWWVAAGVMHPNCRGSWIKLADTPAGVSPAFVDFMDNLLAAKS